MKITRRKCNAVDGKMFYFVEHENKFLCCSGKWCDTFDAHDHIIMGLPCTKYGFGYTTKQRLLNALKEKYESL